MNQWDSNVYISLYIYNIFRLNLKLKMQYKVVSKISKIIN